MKKSVTKLFTLVAMSMAAMSAWAVQPEVGKVYRIVNQGNQLVMSDMGPANSIGCVTSSSTSKSQRWLVGQGSNGALTFRSLSTGMYLKSSNQQSSPWGLSVSNTISTVQMTVAGNNGDRTIKASNAGDGRVYAHCDGSSVVVCWSTDTPTTKWDFTEVSMTQAQIDEALAACEAQLGEQAKEAEYQALLNQIFNDAACTELNAKYAAMSVEQIAADATVTKLPAVLQQMVVKTKSGDWSETDPTDASKKWDSTHAKKYRVQLYEPYSNTDATASWVSTSQYTNMNNPTGVLSDTGTNLYVMVGDLPGGELEQGYTLYLFGATGKSFYNNTTAGVELHKGLNVIPGWADNAHQFVYYTVKTMSGEYNAQGRATHGKYKVTEFPDIKIHIEGGSLNGFTNVEGDALYTPDTDEDYRYTVARARFTMYSLLDKYIHLYWFLEDTRDNEGAGNLCWGVRSVLDAKVNKDDLADWKRLIPGYNKDNYDVPTIVKEWNKMCEIQRITLGINSAASVKNAADQWGDYVNWIINEPVKEIKGYKCVPDQDYADYVNNRHMAYTVQKNFMYATAYHTAYNVNTLRAITTQYPINAGQHWGPAHEYGHNNQHAYKIAGTTEISNNGLANICNYYTGLSTSRAGVPSEQLDAFNRRVSFLDYGLWNCVRFYFQFWQYYHGCGNDKGFYPRFFELLRNYPLQKSYYLNPRYDALQFYKMACVAAQQDLTDFFDSWGFFVPLKNYHIGDYANYYSTLTQADIDAVKAEVKAFGFPKNNQIILIDDRPGSKFDSWDNWFSKERAGVLGGMEDFKAQKTAKGEMSFAINDFMLEVTLGAGADAGVGFLAYDENDNLIAFGNDYKFPISSECAAALVKGTGKLYAVSYNGDKVEVKNTFVDSDATTRLNELTKLLQSIEPDLAMIDEEQRRAGYFMPFYAQSTLEVINYAKSLTAATPADEISKAFVDVIDAVKTLKARENGRVPLIPNSEYNILHKNFAGRGLGLTYSSSKDTYTVKNLAIGKSKYEQALCKWKLEVVDASASTFRIKNTESGLYLGSPALKEGSTTERVKTSTPEMVKKANAGIYTIKERKQGEWTLVWDGNEDFALQIAANVSTGTIGYWGSGDTNGQWILRLADADDKGASRVALQQLAADTREIWPKAGSCDVVGDELHLTAEQISTNAKHIQPGHADNFTSFDVLLDDDTNTYFHSRWNNDAISDDNKAHRLQIDLGEGVATSSFQVNWTTRYNSPTQAPQAVRVSGSNDGKTFTKLTDLKGNLPSGEGVGYTSPIISSDQAYRYIRLEVTQSTAGTNTYFALAELSLNNAQLQVNCNPEYPAVTEELMLKVKATLEDAETVLASSTATAAKLKAAYEPLRAAYDELCQALGVATAPELPFYDSIEEITFEAAQSQGIYDLQGRRLNKISNKGIYIINGKKHLVK